MMAAGQAIRPGRLVGARRPRRLPSEFVPLARAFNAMAAHLGQRERELVATNDRLTVMASIDMLSGLANRRGFQSRLDFEWLKALQNDCDLSLMMIDVDHFKLYNDTYGHPEGDACLTRLGEILSGIAAETMGFAGRYGGEEFCLLLPNTDAAPAMRDRRDGARRRAECRDAAPDPSHQSSPSPSASPALAERNAAPGGPDRSRRCRALCRKTSRPQHGGGAGFVRLTDGHGDGELMELDGFQRARNRRAASTRSPNR